MRTTLLLLLPLLPLALALSSQPLAHRAQHAALARSLTPAERRAFEAPSAKRDLTAASEQGSKKRSLTKRSGKGKRCTPKKGGNTSTSTSEQSAPTDNGSGDQGAGNAAGSPTSQAQDPPPTTQAAPTSTPAPPPSPPTSTTQAAPTTSASSSGGSGGSSSDDPQGILTGPHVGQGTYYAVGLGACGVNNVDSDAIVAVSHLLFDAYPGYAGGNPNNNPVCGKKLRATYNGVTQTVTVQDRCAACQIWDLDMSTSVFDGFADAAVGRISGVTWDWV